MVRQFHPGRKDCQKLFKGRMFGTFKKVVCSGKHFLTKDLTGSQAVQGREEK